ncbi:MAG: helix-hairpin-helix domain-containing protein [Clostridia bacterium]|nr:helix-hairpin-helix domain-containing protein [Clostridia bacterium]
MKRWLFLLPAAALLLLLALHPGSFPTREKGDLPALILQPAQPRPAAEDPLDLNTATAEQLQTLPEIGPVRAQAIVDYREKHGPFRTVEELAAVEGIGAALLDAVLDNVTVTPPEN